jgi:hypothetical protein
MAMRNTVSAPADFGSSVNALTITSNVAAANSRVLLGLGMRAPLRAKLGPKPLLFLQGLPLQGLCLCKSRLWLERPAAFLCTAARIPAPLAPYLTLPASGGE